MEVGGSAHREQTADGVRLSRRAAEPCPATGAEPILGPLIDAARRGDAREVIRLVLDETDAGQSLHDLVGAVVSPALEEIGRRWETDRWSWADEHVATTTIRRAVDTVTARAGRPGEERGRVAVVCAEGDWHSLPGVLFSRLMTASGWPAVFLGPSASPEQLTAVLADRDWDALVITCSLPAVLAGASVLAERVHDHGVPVLIGGAAVTRYRLAVALGADAEVATVAAAVRQLDEWGSTPPRSPGRPRLEWAPEAAEREATGVAAGAMSTLEQTGVMAAGGDAELQGLLGEHLTHAVRVAGAAATLGQPAIFDDFAAWMWRMLAARGLPASIFAAALDALRSGCRDDVAAVLRWSAPGPTTPRPVSPSMAITPLGRS